MELTSKDILVRKIIEKHIMTYQLALFIALNTFEEKDLLRLDYECTKGQRFTPGELEVFKCKGGEVQDCQDVIR